MGLTLYVDDLPPVSPAPTNSPRCGKPLFPLNSKGDGTSIIGPPCSVWGGNVELFYWPPEPSTFSGPITAAPKTTKEAITVIRNTTLTMTSPSVYVSFDVLTAWSEAVKWVFEDFGGSGIGLQSQIGDTYSNYILPMDPQDVSTIRLVVSDWSQYLHSLTAYGTRNEDLISGSYDHTTGSHSGRIGEPFPMDLAGLTAPSPREYFLNPGWACTYGGDLECGTIFKGYHKPQLSLPSQLLNLDPAWSSCELYMLGVHDPPKALTAAKTLRAPAYPTKALPSLSTPAEAASMLVSPTPYATTTGNPTLLFNTKWGAASSETLPSSPTLQESSRYHDHESGSASGQLESKQTEASTTTSAEEVVGNDLSLLLNLHASHTSDAPLPVVVSNAHPGSWNEDANAATTSATLPTHDPDPTGPSAEMNTDSNSRQSSETVPGTSQTGNALSVLSAAYESYLSIESSAALPVVVTSSLPMETSTTQPTVLTLASTSLTLLASTPGEAVQMGTNTIQPGEQVTLDQQTISYGPSGLEVVHAGSTSTYAFDPMPASSTPLEEDSDGRDTFMIGSTTVYKPENTGLAVVDGTTLSVGGSALSMDGQELSLAPSGLAVASGSETKLLSFTDAVRPTSSVSADIATLVIASSTITATRYAPTAVVIGESHKLQAGGPAYTANNEHILTFGPEGLVIANGDQTSTLLATSKPLTPSPHQTVITAGGKALTAAQLSEDDGSRGLSIGDTTLYQDGPALTLSGKVLSAASDGRLVVQDSSMTTTVRLPAVASQETTTASTTPESSAESDAEEGQSISKLPSGSETTTTTAASSTQSARGAGVSSFGDCSLRLCILSLFMVLVHIL
ncbi:hypothetical protein KC340_g10173 [Hortaea werneckii]|nr:hypothetical protein KC342_g8130 [Hortaea werneckii]KAI7074474.1 hypothetical protein KC339_g14059 [Hortaea werneckii]KAI7225450.1 hypothetical protein KC365_g9982 [Hortaea werneckii]KAI7311431.1 hypothetical protein KC340_g10173 [Hortaea werneckii]KAI7385191.1 hypothetical protein KC328_g10450 [Hortaea werneckii]